MVRIVTTQAIVRALSTLRSEFSEATQTAFEFSRAVAEIETIGGLAVPRLAEGLRDVSDAFGIDTLDAAEAQYQTLSNQIATGAESLEFLRRSATFSKAAVTDLQTSVNLLSGALNAYGMSADQVGLVSAKLFKTIELGRTRADEMAGALGRVLPIADSVGVEFDELLAAFATTTVSGIKTTEAVTQLRGVLNAFLKPSEAMKDALRELGFASGEQAIAALGLQGALKGVIGTTDGSTTAIATLIPRVRGLNAALIATGDSAEKYAENLEKIRKTTEATLQQAAERVMASDAERLREEWTRLSNVMVHDLAPGIIRWAANVLEGVNVIRQMSTASGRLEFRLKAMDAILTARTEAFRIAEEARLQALRQARDEQVRILLQQSADVAKIYFKQTREADKANERLIDNAVDAMDRYVEVHRDRLSQLEDAFTSTQDSIRDSQQRVFDLSFQLAGRQFERSLEGLSPEKQISKLFGEAKKLSRRGIQLLDTGNIREGQRFFREALRFADRAEGLGGAGELGDRIIQAQIQAEQRLQKQQQDRLPEIQEQINLQKQAVEFLEQRAKIVRDLLQDELTTTKELIKLGSVFGPGFAQGLAAQRAQVEQQRQAAFEQFRRDQSFDVTGAERILGVRAEDEAAVRELPQLMNEQLTQLERQKSAMDVLLGQERDRNKLIEEALGSEKEFQKARRIHLDPETGAPRRQTLPARTFALVAEIRDDFQRAGDEGFQITDEFATNLSNKIERLRFVLDNTGVAFDSYLLEFDKALPAFEQLVQFRQPRFEIAPDESKLQAITAWFNEREAQSKRIGQNLVPTPPALNRAFGGSAYLAFGGRPRGTDTIPAMLSPGEFVVNARSTKRFFSQLQAINAGQNPVYRESGGQVVNTTVGDIHVHESKNPRLTAQEIDRVIRRGQRRKTI